MHRIAGSYIIVVNGQMVLELFAAKDQTLHTNRNSFHDLDVMLHFLDFVSRMNPKSHCATAQVLNMSQ